MPDKKQRIVNSSHGISIITVTILWFLIYISQWQTALPLAELRFVAAYLMMILPGTILSTLVYKNKNFLSYPLFHITMGFGLSLILISLLGLFGLTFGWSYSFIHKLFIGTALLLMNLFAFQRKFSVKVNFTSQNLSLAKMVILISGILAIVSLGSLVTIYNVKSGATVGKFGPYPGNSDNHLYNAYITDYQNSSSLDFTETIFNSENRPYQRHLFHMWPMTQSMITKMAGVNILEVFFFHNGLLIILASATIYTLARAFGLESIYAITAAVVHLGLISIMQNDFELGKLFFYRVNQDKFFYAFIFYNIVFSALLLYETQRKIPLYSVYFFMVIFSILIHPSAPVFGGMIVGLYIVAQLLSKSNRSWYHTIYILLPWIISASLLLVIRLSLDSNIEIASLALEESTNNLNSVSLERNLYRLNFIEGTPFVGVNSNVWLHPPMIIYLVSTGFAVLMGYNNHLELRRLFFYLLVTSIIIVALLIPYTGWIIGLFVTPFHLWRYLIYTPIGLSIIYALYLLSTKFQVSRYLTYCSILFIHFCIFALIAVMALTGSSVIRTFFAEVWNSRYPNAIVAMREWVDYGHIIEDLAGTDNDRIVVFELPLKDQVPTISTRTIPYIFRSNSSIMINQGGLQQQEANRRLNIYSQIMDPNTPPSDRRALFLSTGAQFIIVTRDPGIQPILTDLNPLLTLVMERTNTILYRVNQTSP